MTIRRVVRTGRARGALLVAALLLTHLGSSAAAAAAPAQQSVITRLNQAATNLAEFGRPLAILALTVVFLAWIAEPMMPDWARENRGALGKVLFGAIVVGLAPDLVTFFLGA